MGCLLRTRRRRQSIPLSESDDGHVLASSTSVPAYASRATCRQKIPTSKTVPMEERTRFMATPRRSSLIEGKLEWNCTAEEGNLSELDGRASARKEAICDIISELLELI